MANGKLYIGTSGWSYGHWRGVLYPEGLAQRKWLESYARVFPTVELNVTYYRIPKKSVFEGWHARTPQGFRFAVKLNKQITHIRRLIDCGEVLEWFLGDASALKQKFGPLLVQLPPSFRKDAAVLDAFLRTLREHPKGRGLSVVLEFRHDSWLDDETNAILREHDAALCFADYPTCSADEPATAKIVYVRRHGPAGSHRQGYSNKELRADAGRIRGHLSAGRDVYVFFNNDVGGHAVRNAAALTEMLTRKKVILPESGVPPSRRGGALRSPRR